MSFTVKSRGCAALSQPATRPSSRTWASLGCEAITHHGRAHAVALGAQQQMESSPKDGKNKEVSRVHVVDAAHLAKPPGPN